MWVIVGESALWSPLSNLEDILSGPEALFGFKPFKSLFTTSTDMETFGMIGWSCGMSFC